MPESDPGLSDPAPGGVTANVRVGAVENRLSDADRLALIEASLASHDAIFREREKAETQAQNERVLAARAAKETLDEAAKALAAQLDKALESADKLEQERIARVKDSVEEVKTAATVAIETTEKQAREYQEAAAETLKQHNGLIAEMRTKDGNYQTKDVAAVQKAALEERIEGVKERLDSGEGAAHRSERISASLVAWAAVGALVLSVLVGVVVKFA